MWPGSRPPRPRTDDFLSAAGPQGVRVIDAVADSEGRHDERQDLVAGVLCAGRRQMDVLVDERLQAEVLRQGWPAS